MCIKGRLRKEWEKLIFQHIKAPSLRKQRGGLGVSTCFKPLNRLAFAPLRLFYYLCAIFQKVSENSN